MHQYIVTGSRPLVVWLNTGLTVGLRGKKDTRVRKLVVIGVAAVLIGLIGLISVGGFFGWRYLRPQFFKMASQPSKAWDAELVLDETIKADTPFAMVPGKNPVGQSSGNTRSDYFRGSGHGMTLVAASFRFSPGVPVNTGSAASHMAERFRSEQFAKKNGIEGLEVIERKREVLGEPAYEVEISGSAKGVTFRNRLITFSRKATRCTIGLDSVDTPETLEVWNRIIGSIRWIGPVDEFEEAPGLSTGSPQLPPGFTPRNLGTKEKSE